MAESLAPEARRKVQDHQSIGISLGSLLRQRSFLTLLGVTFFATLAFSALPATFALYADRVLFTDSISPNILQLRIGLMLTLYGLMAVITQVGLLKPLVHRFGEKRLLILGSIALMLGMFGVGLVTTALLAVIFFAPFAFGQGVIHPSLQSLITRFGIHGTGGRMLGLYQSSRSLALILGPLWAGYAFEQIDPRSVYFIGSVLMVVAIILTFYLLRSPLHQTDTTPILDQP